MTRFTDHAVAHSIRLFFIEQVQPLGTIALPTPHLTGSLDVCHLFVG